MKEINCSVDSLPLTSTVFDSFDYSGSQIYGLTNSPLSCLINDEARASFDGEKISLKINNLYWEDGQKITADDFINGVNKIIDTIPFFKKFLLRDVIKLQSRNNFFLDITLKEKNFRILDVLSLLNFSPLRIGAENLSSGAYRIVEICADKSMILSKNDFMKSDFDTLKISLIKEPEDNISLFEKGALDITADTAFPYEKFELFCNKSILNKADVGLFSAIEFSDNFSSLEHLNLRLLIASIIHEIDFNSLLHGASSGNLGFVQKFYGTVYSKKTLAEKQTLTMSYNDYYPNKEACLMIKNACNKYGIEINLIKDDYYKPSKKTDMSFVITRNFSSSNYMKYALYAFYPTLRAIPELHKKYLNTLAEIEYENLESSRKFDVLCTILKKCCCFIPLFNIPSIYLSSTSKPNPLLKFV